MTGWWQASIVDICDGWPFGAAGRVNNDDEMRPDGREVMSETRKLRTVTRMLRHHLDTLPIDYDLDVSADRFLAGLAFMFARQRYDCADSMIGAGMGGTVILVACSSTGCAGCGSVSRPSVAAAFRARCLRRRASWRRTGTTATPKH